MQLRTTLPEKAGWRVNPYWITSLHAVKTKLMPLKPIMQVSKRLLSWNLPKYATNISLFSIVLIFYLFHKHQLIDHLTDLISVA